MRHELYFSSDEIRDALKVLGPTGDRAEATVAIAAETLASLIEPFGEDLEFGEDTEFGWRVDHYLGSATARQAGSPHVVLTRVTFEDDTEETS